MIIAWTYLMHANLRERGVDYRYYEQINGRKRYEKTKHGAFKFWELEKCLRHADSPIDADTTNNLRFLIGIRHEIEHQMTQSLDAWLGGRYQACSLNYNHYIKALFGSKFGLDNVLAFSLQFSDFEPRDGASSDAVALPAQVKNYIAEFDEQLTEDQFNSPRYAYKLLFTRRLVNHAGQADKVIEFIDPDSELAKSIDKQYVLTKLIDRPKFRAKDVVDRVREAGFPSFRVHHAHTNMWQANDAKNPSKGYGIDIQGTWYWYQSWIDRCISLCAAAGDAYR